MHDLEDADLAELRDANPVRVDQVPARSLARIQSVTFDQLSTTAEGPSRTWRQRGLGVSLAGVVASLAIVAALGQGPSAPGIPDASGSMIAAGLATDGAATSASGESSISSGSVVVGDTASCARLYSMETLADRSWAYDATVTAVVADQVTFRVDETFRGAAAETVSLSAVGQGGTDPTSEGGPAFVVGQRYLISGEDKNVWGCGFSRQYDATTASQWRRVFGG